MNGSPGRPLARGFTLIEVLVAASLSVFVTIAAISILVQAAMVADVITSKVRINQEARLVFGMLLDGGVVDRAADGEFGTADAIPGYHGGVVVQRGPGSLLDGPPPSTPTPPAPAFTGTNHTCPMITLPMLALLRASAAVASGMVNTDLNLRIPDVYSTAAGASEDTVGLRSSVPSAPRLVACFDEDEVAQTVGPGGDVQTIGYDGASLCPASSATPTVNGFVSVLEQVPVGGLSAETDDMVYLRFDAVDISLLALPGDPRRFARRQHTETFITQVRCQREYAVP